MIPSLVAFSVASLQKHDKNSSAKITQEQKRSDTIDFAGDGLLFSLQKKLVCKMNGFWGLETNIL